MMKPRDPVPRISIITVVRNGRDTIEQTIKSVLQQDCADLEYLVIDGGSTDGTVEIIRKYADRLSFWASEPDNGIYEAMNKALDRARGSGHLFLNAGDHFVGDVLSGELTIPSHLPVSKKDIFNKIRLVRPRDYRQGLPYCHQGIIFETKGVRFNTNYRFAADYLYYLEYGYTLLPSSAVSGHVYYDDAGLSKINSTIRDREIASIIRARFGIFWYSLFVAKCAVKDLIRAVIRR